MDIQRIVVRNLNCIQSSKIRNKKSYHVYCGNYKRLRVMHQLFDISLFNTNVPPISKNIPFLPRFISLRVYCYYTFDLNDYFIKKLKLTKQNELEFSIPFFALLGHQKFLNTIKNEQSNKNVIF